jgi:hypothetical protein
VLKSAREYSKCNATHIELKLFVVIFKIGLYLIKRFRNEISQIAGKFARFIKAPDITGFYTGKFTLTKKKFSCVGMTDSTIENRSLMTHNIQ